MKRNPLTLSIVIPAYNEENHLKACLESIASQKVKPDEVLIVDNNSTDKTESVAKLFGFTKLIHEPQQGIVFARNRGFSAAKSQIIARIDADSWLAPDWVERIKIFYADDSNNNKSLTGGPNFSGIGLSRIVAWTYSFFIFNINRLLIGHPSLWGSNMAITKEQWHAIRSKICLRDDVHEDLDLSMHLHEQGYKIQLDRNLKIVARLHRVYSDRRQLWEYLMWWPNNLKVHHKKTWVLAWFFSCLLFIAGLFLRAVSR